MRTQNFDPRRPETWTEDQRRRFNELKLDIEKTYGSEWRVVETAPPAAPEPRAGDGRRKRTRVKLIKGAKRVIAKTEDYKWRDAAKKMRGSRNFTKEFADKFRPPSPRPRG